MNIRWTVLSIALLIAVSPPEAFSQEKLRKTTMSATMADIFQGRPPSVPRDLWPGVDPETPGKMKAEKGTTGIPASFEVFTVEVTSSTLDIMKEMAQKGYFIGDPYQYRQFSKQTGWQIPEGAISSSRELRFFCQRNAGCIPPLIFQYHTGKWMEKNEERGWVANPLISKGTKILFCKPVAERKRK